MHRPRRKRATRCLEYNNGMLHEEEVALRRALHASLAAIKSQGDEEESNRIEDKKNNCSSSSGIKANQRAASFSKLDETSQRKRFKRSNYENAERCRKKLNKRTVLAQSSNGHSKKFSQQPSVSNGVKLNEKKLRKKKKPAENVVNNSNKRTNESLPKVRVQRKFAQANVLSPRSLHMFQSQMQPTTTRAKTEDFLDFLCLRGSSTLPTSLNMFNNPCAPLSPLSDEEDDSKSSSSKIINDDENIDEPKSSLLEQHCVSNTSCKTNSHMSSPTSARAQPRAILPEFTNNHGVFSNIPSPISYPSSSTTPCKQPGFNEYGIPTSCPATPPLIPMGPRLSTCVTKSSVLLGESKSFHSIAASSNENVDSLCTEDEGNIESCRPLEKKKRQTCLFKDSSEIDETKIAKDVIKKKDMVAINKENFEALNTEKENQNVPVFTPTESEFKNPMKFFESIKANVEKFGICLISPPKSWQPEYSLSDEIRFTTKLQRIHCLKKKCPSVEVEMCAIKNHLEDQNILFTTMPQIAGCELDLPFMSKVVEEFGGLQQIIDKRKWHKVADSLRIPKSATDRTTKLEHIYCKYLLSYDMLLQEEKTRLREIASQELNNQKTASQYLTKGRSMSLALFQRNAKILKSIYCRKMKMCLKLRKYLIEYLVKVKDTLLSILLSLRERHSQPVK
ncbi:protein Jumonji-like [Xenia sp. Carnegie-2017]|uniref:protein Jumonji-like n=1 Tax=Xenia sp. Carnegie-2017 TaxID=2897299 RepID=UPI001F035E19|nr:protein Jumonji-like [Xenia sp. Carnegie-2017]